ncbi:MAG: hypothetical protein AB7K24_25510 [Gemmataceae bacterium]
MRSGRKRNWLTLALAACSVLGCKSSQPNPSFPEEPLLLSKTPVAGNLEVIEPGRTVIAETQPAAPPRPYDGMASEPSAVPLARADVRPSEAAAPSQPDYVTQPTSRRRPLQAQPAIRSGTQPVQAEPAIRRQREPLPAQPASREGVNLRPYPDARPPVFPTPDVPAAAQPAGDPRYAHCGQFTWVQGVLDRHYKGGYHLRYSDPSRDDCHGGKVRLIDDPRLKDFQEGDVVRIKGAIVDNPNGNSAPRSCWKHYPYYRVDSIELVERRQR